MTNADRTSIDALGSIGVSSAKSSMLPRDYWDFSGVRERDLPVAFYYELCRASPLYCQKVEEWRRWSKDPQFHAKVLKLAKATPETSAWREYVVPTARGGLAAFQWPTLGKLLPVPREFPASFEDFPAKPWKRVSRKSPARKFWRERLAPRKFSNKKRAYQPTGFVDLQNAASDKNAWEEVRELIEMGQCSGAANAVAVLHWNWFEHTDEELCEHFRRWLEKEREWWTVFRAQDGERSVLGPVPFRWPNALRALSTRERYRALFCRSSTSADSQPEKENVQALIEFYRREGDEDLRARRPGAKPSTRAKHAVKTAKSQPNLTLQKIVSSWIRWGDRLVNWVEREGDWRADPPPAEQKLTLHEITERIEKSGVVPQP